MAAMIALAGCTATPATSPTQDTGPVTAADQIGNAAWLDGGQGAAVVSLGSSSCVPKAGEVIGSGQTITANFAPLPADTVCTSDLAARASYLPIPDGIDPQQNVVIIAAGGLTGSVELPGVSTVGAPAEHAPSAGWVEGGNTMEGVGDGSFAFLTWGSSTCPPTVKSITATSDSAVTVTLEASTSTPCTMDIAPRVGLGEVPASVTGDAVTVTFAGAVTGTTQMLGSR